MLQSAAPVPCPAADRRRAPSPVTPDGWPVHDPADIIGALLGRTRQDPDRVLVSLYGRTGVERIGQGALLARSARFAALYRARHVERGEVVFIALKTSLDLLAAFVGAALVRAVPSLLPLPSAKQDPALFWRSHEALFRHVGARTIVTDPDYRDALRREVAPGLIEAVVAADLPEAAFVIEPAPASADDVACLQHSSGTTGLKKGVPLTHRMVARQIAAYADAIGIGPDDTIASWLPLYHDMGFVACFLLPLATGCPVVLIDPFTWLGDPLMLFDAAARERARFAWLPNFAFQHLVNAAPDDRRRVDLGGMRAFVNCSEPCRPETVRGFAERFASWGVRPDQLQVCYAMAEATFAVTQTAPGSVPAVLRLDRAALETEGRAAPAGAGPARESLSTGRPIRGFEVAVRDPDGTDLPDDRVGEITIRGPSLFQGYDREPGRTGERLRDGWYRTGDRGFLHGGELHVIGRADDLMIVRGRNIVAHEVEALVGSVPGVKPGRAVAFGLYRAEIGSEDVVVVAELARDGADAAAIRRLVRTRLESVLGLVPARIKLVGPGWLSKTTSGKISRRHNRDKFLASEALR